ncbi:MAG: hypothetical protein DRO40_00900 [Thermoprotei archaeon]|nr:MAG: hypothetical protein DRO40_00900 [Thermoprotei archaeon]
MPLPAIPAIEEIFTQYSNIFITIIIMVFARILIVRLINSLFERGVFSVGTRVILIRIIDTAVIMIILATILHQLAATYATYIVIAVFAAMVLVLFFYEIKEFTAYISLQLIKHIKGRNLEIYLPGHTKPIYGKVISIDPLFSTIEDIFGNKIHVVNSLLVNAIVKEHTPSIILRLTLRPTANTKLYDLIKRVHTVFDESRIPVFRIHENQIEISKIQGNVIVLNLNVTPISMPIRVSDMIRLINHLMVALKEYDPEIEIVK